MILPVAKGLMIMTKKHYALILLLTAIVSLVEAAEYFVSPGGSDQNPGTKQKPFATIRKAASLLRPGDTCYLREGVYREKLRPEVSGRDGAEITFSGYRSEKAVISGADRVEGWEKEAGNVYSAPVAWSLDDGNQVFCDGVMLSEACWPDAGKDQLLHPRRAAVSSGSPVAIVCADIPGSSNSWDGAQVWCAGGSAWICWSATVTAYNAGTHTLTFEPAKEGWYTPRAGNLFVLRGVRFALDTPGEWLYDKEKGRLLLIPPEGVDINKAVIEVKRRLDAIDLRGRSYIQIKGIEFTAGGIRTDESSSNLMFESLKGSYVSHSYLKDVSAESGVLLFGKNILLLNSDLGFSSASVVSVNGEDHRIINCYIHHGGYAGLWKGTVSLAGRRILFSHNTVRHAGRDLINTHGLMESLVQYNDVFDAGWLTSDLGMFYGHNTDYANTRFCYNLVHDNHAKSCAMGIYFDHLSHNAIVHNNVIWNAGTDPLRINNPSYCNLVFNNTCWRTGVVSTFDHSKRDDMFGSRFSNNILRGIRLPAHVVVTNNLILDDPPFVDAGRGDFRLKGMDTAVGAYPHGGSAWRAGCDLQNPPNPLPVYKASSVLWMNGVKNACFEFGTLEGWEQSSDLSVQLCEGNGWGNDYGTKKEPHATGTSRYELKLGPGSCGVRQLIKGLSPGTTYTLSCWMRVSADSEKVVLGVRNHGAPEVCVEVQSVEWTRRSIDFTTGSKDTEATVYLLKASPGEGFAWCDNVTLPLRSAGGVGN